MRYIAALYALALAACSVGRPGAPYPQAPLGPSAFFASGVFVADGAAIFFDDAQGGPALFGNGVSASRVGRGTTFDGGARLQRYGDVVFFSDGATAKVVGDTVLFSDGRTCRRFGRSLSCL